MKEKIKNDLPMLVGILIAMVIVDAISNDSFDVMPILLKIITTIAVYLFFRFLEFRKKSGGKK